MITLTTTITDTRARVVLAATDGRTAVGRAWISRGRVRLEGTVAPEVDRPPVHVEGRVTASGAVFGPAVFLDAHGAPRAMDAALARVAAKRALRLLEVSP